MYFEKLRVYAVEGNCQLSIKYLNGLMHVCVYIYLYVKEKYVEYQLLKNHLYELIYYLFLHLSQLNTHLHWYMQIPK